MKAHKKVLVIAISAILASALLLTNAMPALADEVIEQVEASDMTEDVTTTSNEDNTENKAEEVNTDESVAEVSESEVIEPEISESEVENAQPRIIETVNNWNKHEPNNELVISRDKLGGTVIAGKMTADQPMVIWTENPLSVEEQENVFNSLKGNPGVGNPKDVVYISGNDASMYGMTIDSENGTVSFDGKNNWSLLFSGEYVVKKSEDNPDQGILSDPEEKKDTDTLPELEEHPNIDEHPEIENHPDTDEQPEKENHPDTDEQPESPSLDNPSGNNTGNSGGSQAGGGSSGGGSRSSGSGSGGPGMQHVLDEQPETGLLDTAKGRVLDEVPKTGMPMEFSVLLIVSAISLITLVITLIAERKTAKRNK